MIKPIYIKVGGAGPYDPAAGATECNIPYLKGMELYLEKSEVGTMVPGTYSALSTGGFSVVTPFVLNDEYFIHLSGLSYGTGATDYSNGFCLSKVNSALFGRVGWLQPTDADAPVINSTNLLSKSGRYFNDGSFHALSTVQNIKSIMEDAGANTSVLNSHLERMQKSVIARALNGVFCEPEYIEQTLLYKRHGGNKTLLPNDEKFIGVRFIVPSSPDLAIQIDSIGLLFDSDVTFNLYLFNDIKQAPVWTSEVTAVANTQVVAELADVVLNYIGGENHGGIFYLGYFQDELGSAKAIRESDVHFVCNTIFGYQMIESEAIGANDFNRSEISYTMQSNGLNPHVSVFRDHTWQIVKKASLFDNVIGMQMAIQVIESIMFSKRSNSDERVLKDTGAQLSASLDLNGVAPVSDGPQTFGIKAQVLKELQRLRKSFYPVAKSQSVNVC